VLNLKETNIEIVEHWKNREYQLLRMRSFDIEKGDRTWYFDSSTLRHEFQFLFFKFLKIEDLISFLNVCTDVLLYITHYGAVTSWMENSFSRNKKFEEISAIKRLGQVIL
jgi:hypothetical protein